MLRDSVTNPQQAARQREKAKSVTLRYSRRNTQFECPKTAPPVLKLSFLWVVKACAGGVYEVRPHEDKSGVDLISDALPFGRLQA